LISEIYPVKPWISFSISLFSSSRTWCYSVTKTLGKILVLV
jgi:hypothetical protein